MKRSTAGNFGSLLLAALLFWSLPSASHGSAPLAGKQAPGYFRLMVGEAEVTALLDGTFSFGPEILRNTTPLLTRRLWERAGIFAPEAPAAVNAFLINTGGRLILIDTGRGIASGPDGSALLDNLRESGYRPSEVDAILLTHAHGDHLGGLLGPDGRRAFPNAVVMLAKEESDFWLSPENEAKAPPGKRKSFARARSIAGVCATDAAWKTFEPGSELFPGLTSEAAFGHTPGNTVYLLRSGGQAIVFIGDCIHEAASQFPMPTIGVGFDTDMPAAVHCRTAMFSRIARERTLAAGAHLAFPGIGRIRADGRGFAWLPVPFAPVRPQP